MFATHRTWPHSRGVRCRRRSLTGDICAWQIAYGGAPHAHAGNSEEEEERRGMMIKVRNEGSRDEEKPMRGEGLRMRARPRRRAKRPRAGRGQRHNGDEEDRPAGRSGTNCCLAAAAEGKEETPSEKLTLRFIVGGNTYVKRDRRVLVLPLPPLPLVTSASPYTTSTGTAPCPYGFRIAKLSKAGK